MLTRGIKSKEDDIVKLVKLAGRLDKEIHNPLWKGLFPDIFPSNSGSERQRINLEVLSWRDLRKVIRELRKKIDTLTFLTSEVTKALDTFGGFPDNANSGFRGRLGGHWSFARQLIRKGEEFLEEEIKRRKEELEELEK